MYAQDLRRSHEEVRAQLRRLTSLHAVNLAIAAALDVDDVVRIALDGVGRLMGYAGAAIYVAIAESEPLQLRDVRGDMEPLVTPMMISVPAAETMINEVSESNLTLPLRSGNRLVGVLRLRREAPPYDQDERQLAELVASQAAVAILNAQVFQLTHSQAITDGLTGLFNHRYFDQSLIAEVERASRLNYPIGLLMTDLDRFKAVNDTLGHQVGDDMLRQVAAAVISSVRKTDLVARYGGDEIVVILPGCRRQALFAVGEKVRGAAERVARRISQVVPVTVSVGGAMFPEDAGTATELVSCADRALYQAKMAGRNRVVLSEPA